MGHHMTSEHDKSIHNCRYVHGLSCHLNMGCQQVGNGMEH